MLLPRGANDTLRDGCDRGKENGEAVPWRLPRHELAYPASGTFTHSAERPVSERLGSGVLKAVPVWADDGYGPLDVEPRMYFDVIPMSYVRACRAAVFATVCVIVLAVTGVTAAATVPGWSVAKANGYLEANLRIVDSAIVAAAKEASWTSLQPGGGIPSGQLGLQRARAGMDVRHATCLGVTSGSTGYVSFNCALLLSDGIGYRASASGELKRLANGDWRWSTAAYSRSAG